FTDQKGRSFALRPEGTAPVVRSYVENHLEMQGGRTRLYYMGPMFRYDRPQAGRYRQFYQYGVEFIGSNHPYYDAEVIALEMTFLKALGLTRPRLEINSVGCAECARDYDKALRDYYAPHLNELCPDCQKRYELKPRRLLDCKVPSCKAFRKDAPSQFDYLDASCREHFDAVCRYLDQMKISYQINPAIVRGLDYYTNTAFELICDELGAQNSIAGGGRYNALIAQVGGKDTPGIGFAGGFERLLLALEKENIQLPQSPNPTLFMVLMGEEAVDFALPLIAELRQKGIYVDYNPEKGSFKAQLKAADSMNARYALIIGEHEAISRTLVLKDLSSGEQQSLSADELLSFPFEA
ncbi:MAG TPA: histidine--tRNA ligase, partial [Candidatus Cloacimonadota bacterium]|nr:histidine--tRNA ligase [Candidatus Cloacimonadota bacterium]